MIASVAFLGLGTMGRGMAQNLLDAGHDLTVWNRTASKADDLVSAGAALAATPADAARAADIVLYCLANNDAVESVVFGDDGLLGAAAGQVFVDMSTVSPGLSQREAEAFADAGADFLTAPVFGSKPQAEAGELWVVAGGPDAALDRARPALEALSQSIFHMGEEAGAGTSMKLTGNLLVSAMATALAESLVLAKKAGLDPDQVLEVIQAADFRSPTFEGAGRSMIDHDFAVNFSLGHMLKDATLIRHFAEDTGTPIPAFVAVRERLQAAANAGWADENFSALVKAAERDADTSLA